MTPAPECPSVLIADFDGTLTAVDFYYLARTRLIPPDTPDYYQEHLIGGMTHFDCLVATYSAIVRHETEVRALLPTLGMPPNFGELVATLADAGWQLWVASAGCRWYIDILLDSTLVPVHANLGEFVFGQGLVMRPDLTSPYHCPNVGIDKSKVVTAAQGRFARVAYLGDGATDAHALRHVAPEYRYAKHEAARLLGEWNEPYRPFTTFEDCVRQLLGD